MKKITTLFKKDPSNLGRVIDEIDPENEWALTEGIATQKFDGTACAVINGELYKRYDAKHGKPAPVGGIPCQEPDPITGHWPHWVRCETSNPADKWAFEAFGYLINSNHQRAGESLNGTYELCGPKVKNNPESLSGHYLLKHGFGDLQITDRSFDSLKDLLSQSYINIEGLVFHHPDGRMCKIRKSDFGFKRHSSPVLEP